MHHKRKRSRNQRAGCKMCKYWKVNGFTSRDGEGFEKFGDHQRRLHANEEIKDVDKCCTLKNKCAYQAKKVGDEDE